MCLHRSSIVQAGTPRRAERLSRAVSIAVASSITIRVIGAVNRKRDA
jgi:hypothetical protein